MHKDTTGLIGFKLIEGGEVIKYLRHVKSGDSFWLVRCNCGKEFETKKRNIIGYGKAKPLHSCRKCAHKRRGKLLRKTDEMIGKKFGRWTVIAQNESDKYGQMHYFCQCPCGTERIVNGKAMRLGLSTSCGCINVERCKAQVGAKHPNWNPNYGEVERKRIDRNSTRWWSLRKRVWERDNYTCLKCQIRGGKLTAHHCDGWSWCIEGRFASDNVVTLCVACHDEYHSIYGIKKVIREDFRKFIPGFI